MSAIMQMIAPWDEAALTGLVSKGVMIRAGKDAAKASVEMTDRGACVTVGEVTVTLTPPDLKSAQCSCGVPFPCRHVITAVLALRLDAPPFAAAPPEAEKPASASANPAQAKTPPLVDVAALPFATVEKHAGKDWPRALALATTPVHIDESGEGTRSVTFGDTDEVVTFPHGLPLKQALFKGAKPGRARLVVAAAALVLASRSGQELPENVTTAESRTVDFQILGTVEAAIFDAVLALSAGAVGQAADRLFTLAISTRAEAVPRLAAELRGLSRQMTQEALRRADETPETLLLALSRTHALIRALRATPDDPALIGRLARSFNPSGAMDVTFLGAEQWQTPAGARGMTMAFLDLKTQKIHRATVARAAGTDLTYNPETTWHHMLWSVAKPQDMHGRAFHLADAALAHDGGLGLSQTATDAGPAPVPLKGLRDWAGLGAAFDRQMGRGLRRLPGEALLLLQPKTTLPPEFDPYTQKWMWIWFDETEVPFTLTLPVQMRTSPERLAAYSRRIATGLIALSANGDARVLGIWTTGSGAGQYVLQFDPLPKPQGWTAFMDKVRKQIAPVPAKSLPPISPLRLCLDRAAEAALASLSRPVSSDLANRCQEMGLNNIATAVESLDGSAKAAMNLGYLLALAQTALGEEPL